MRPDTNKPWHKGTRDLRRAEHPHRYGTCTVCHTQQRITVHGVPWRHKGITEFDVATDGMCSGSDGLCLEDMYITESSATEADATQGGRQ